MREDGFDALEALQALHRSSETAMAEGGLDALVALYRHSESHRQRAVSGHVAGGAGRCIVCAVAYPCRYAWCAKEAARLNHAALRRRDLTARQHWLDRDNEVAARQRRQDRP